MTSSLKYPLFQERRLSTKYTNELEDREPTQDEEKQLQDIAETTEMEVTVVQGHRRFVAQGLMSIILMLGTPY